MFLQLEKEHARLLPALQKLEEKERRQGKKMVQVNQNMGFSQAFEYGEQSNLEYVSRNTRFLDLLTLLLSSRTRIAALQKQVIKLASRVDTPIAQPPSSPR